MEHIELIRNILLALSGVTGFTAIAFVPSIYKRIVKPYDAIFLGKGLTFEEGVWFLRTIMRMSQYTLCIVMPERSKKDRYAKQIYKGYDFRGKSNKTQIRLSYIFVYGMFISIVLGLMFTLLDAVVIPMLH